MAFLQRLAPNGQKWAAYCGAVPPRADANGNLCGVWGELMCSASVFEFTNPGWQQYPGYSDEDGPGGQVINFLTQCGYGSFVQLVESAEEMYRQEMQDAEGDPYAFLRQRAENGMQWKEYTAMQEPSVAANGFINGAWGECLTAAVIFEHQNPDWSKLSLYCADGPAGQVINYFLECGHNVNEELMSKTEAATHQAIDSGRKVPVFEDIYQCIVGQQEAPVVGGPPPNMTGRKFALLVGCNYTGSSCPLKGCINDVHSWYDVLTSVYNFEPEDILMLTDDQNDPQKKPTLANMKTGLRWLVSGAQPGDVLFWQFSGHGTQQTSQTQTEEDGKDEALCPCDYKNGLFIDDEIFDIAVLPLQSGIKLTIILDCCHSGTAVDLPFRWEGSNWSEVGGTSYTAGDVQMFSGCQDDQTSADVQSGGKAGGAMTMSMTQAIRENPGMSYPELLDRLREILEEGGFSQYPQLTSSQMFDPRSKRFSLTDGAIPNQNAVLGSSGPPRLQPERPNGGWFASMFG